MKQIVNGNVALIAPDVSTATLEDQSRVIKFQRKSYKKIAAATKSAKEHPKTIGETEEKRMVESTKYSETQATRFKNIGASVCDFPARTVLETMKAKPLAVTLQKKANIAAAYINLLEKMSGIVEKTDKPIEFPQEVAKKPPTIDVVEPKPLEESKHKEPLILKSQPTFSNNKKLDGYVSEPTSKLIAEIQQTIKRTQSFKQTTDGNVNELKTATQEIATLTKETAGLSEQIESHKRNIQAFEEMIKQTIEIARKLEEKARAKAEETNKQIAITAKEKAAKAEESRLLADEERKLREESTKVGAQTQELAALVGELQGAMEPSSQELNSRQPQLELWTNPTYQYNQGAENAVDGHQKSKVA